MNMSNKYKKLRKLAKTQRVLTVILALLCAILMGIAGGSDNGDINMSEIIIGVSAVIIAIALTAARIKTVVIAKRNLRYSIKLQHKCAAHKLEKAVAEDVILQK